MRCSGLFRNWLIYIPLCLDLYVNTGVLLGSIFFIYIPLCLYLYHSSHCVKVSAFWHLHSTMFRFIFKHSPLNHVFVIQFTFHYVYIYMVKEEKYRKIFFIYIPLCLYLYVKTTSDAGYYMLIYIPLYLYLLGIDFQFAF